MPQKTGFIPDTNQSGFIPDDNSGFIPDEHPPARAVGPNPAAPEAPKEPPFTMGGEDHTPWWMKAKNELHDAFVESRLPHLPDIPWITKPPEFLSEYAHKKAVEFSEPVTEETGLSAEAIAAGGEMHPNTPKVRTRANNLAFLGGAMEGAATQATGLNVALELAGQGEVAALRNANRLSELGETAKAASAFKTARRLETATRAVSVPLGAESVGAITDPNATLLERIQAVPGLAGAALGMRARLPREMPTSEVKTTTGEKTAPTPEKPNLTEPIATPTQPEAKPEVKRPDSITIKMGPKTMENIQKLLAEGFRVKEASGEQVTLERTKPAISPEPSAIKVDGGLDEKTAIIEDQRPMWDLDEGKFYSVGTPVELQPGKWGLSHGILTPETQADLNAKGIRLVKRSEMEAGGIEPVSASAAPVSKDYGIPLERLTPADRTMTDTRLDDLTRKFADMSTARTPPEAAVSEARRAELLQKLGGKQGEEPVSLNAPEEPSAIMAPEDNDAHIQSLLHRINRINSEIAFLETQRPNDPNIEMLKANRAQLHEEYQRTSVGMGNKKAMSEDEFMNLDTPDVAMSRAVDEQGNPIETKEFTPEELAARKKQIATDWYKARLEARALDINDRAYRDLGELRRAIEAKKAEPSFQTEEGGMDIGNPREMIEIFRNTYSDNVGMVASKELLQNALDATKGMGDKGEITIRMDDKAKTFEMQDNGPGLLPSEFKELYLKLSSSGKRGKNLGTIGELGVGKVSYLIGGESVSVTSVARDPQTGKVYVTTMDATPEQMLNKTAQIHVRESRNTDAETGITTKVQFANQEAIDKSDKFLNGFLKYSSFGAKVSIEHNSKYGQLPNKTYEPKQFKPLKVLGSGEIPGSTKWRLSIPDQASLVESQGIDLVLNNRGMYQGVDRLWLPRGKYPDHIVVELDPTVIGTSTEYPLTAPVRESLKKNVKAQITNWVNENIVKKGVQDRLVELGRIYDSMLANTDSTGEYVMYDAGGRFTPEEFQSIKDSSDITLLGHGIKQVMTDLIRVAPGHKLLGPLTDIGFVFEDKLGGVNLKNPNKDSFTILINPFELAIERGVPNKNGVNIDMISDPATFARRMVHVAVHEFTHLGQRNEGAPFTWFLGEMYGAYPLEQQIRAAERIKSNITTPTGEFTPEFHELLQKYIDSRRRSGTTKDSLLGERDINSFTKRFGPQAIRSGDIAGGTRITRLTLKGLGPESKLNKAEKKQVIKGALDLGLVPTGFSDKNGNPMWQKPRDEEVSKFSEIWNLPRGLMSVDLPFITSAAMRQGLPLIGPNFKGWVKAWGDSATAYRSEVAAAQVMDKIAQAPIFRRGRDANGNPTLSFAEQIGLEMADTQTLTGREEALKSKWAEKIPLWGRHVAASNRAYTAFMNSLRASSATRFLHQAAEDSLMFKLTGGKFGREGIEPTENLAFARSIAEAVNTLSGRGKLQLEFTPDIKVGDYQVIKGRTYSAERASKLLTDVFFAPKLVASRVKMLNPNTYISANPYTRQLYMKGVLGAMASWWTIASLIEAAGGEVSKDPNDADFGKGRIGNTRIDPGAGFQQFLVLGSRLRPSWFKSPVPIPFPPYGEMVDDPGGQLFTSSTTGRTSHLGQGFRPLTSGELIQNFVRSKLHPTAALIADMLYATQDRQVFVGDRAIQLVAPMMAGDLIQVMQQDPGLAPLVLGASNVGMGGSTYGGGPTKPTFTPAMEQLTGIPFTEYDPTVGGR